MIKSITLALGVLVLYPALLEGQNQADAKKPPISENIIIPQKAMILDETFNGGMMPAGWIVSDGYSDGYTWDVVPNHNGSTFNGTPFLMVNSDAAGSGVQMDETVTTPAYDISSMGTVLLEFSHFFQAFSGNELCDVDVWNGSAWITVYSCGGATVGSFAAPNHQIIDVSAHKNSAFKIRFHYYQVVWDWYWSIEDVKLYTSDNDDIGISAISAPANGFGLSATEPVTVEVSNYGNTAQTSIPLNFQIDGGAIVTEVLNSSYPGFISLSPGNTFLYTFSTTANVSAIGTHTVTAWTSLAADAVFSNDTMEVIIENNEYLAAVELDSILNNLAGIETNGEFYFLPFWNDGGKFAKYDLNGTLVDTFRLAGLNAGIRDLAYDPTTEHFFGGEGSSKIYEMDLAATTPALIGEITCPLGYSVRHIAYDTPHDGFWIGNWDTDIVLINKSGEMIVDPAITNPIPAANLSAVESRYGSAYDNWSCGGPFLWVFAQADIPSNVLLGQISIATGELNVPTMDIEDQFTLSGSNPLAGGLFAYEFDTINHIPIIGGLIQNAHNSLENSNLIFGFEINDLSPGLSLQADSVFPANGAVNVQLDQTISVYFNDIVDVIDLSGIAIYKGTTPINFVSASISANTLTIVHPQFEGDTLYEVLVPANSVSGPCTDNSEIRWSFRTGTVGIENPSLFNGKIYPNPAHGYINIEGFANSEYRIISLDGRIVQSGRIDNRTQSIDIRMIQSGLYYFEANNGQGSSQNLLLMIE